MNKHRSLQFMLWVTILIIAAAVAGVTATIHYIPIGG